MNCPWHRRRQFAPGFSIMARKPKCRRQAVQGLAVIGGEAPVFPGRDRAVASATRSVDPARPARGRTPTASCRGRRRLGQAPKGLLKEKRRGSISSDGETADRAGEHGENVISLEIPLSAHAGGRLEGDAVRQVQRGLEGCRPGAAPAPRDARPGGRPRRRCRACAASCPAWAARRARRSRRRS